MPDPAKADRHPSRSTILVWREPDKHLLPVPLTSFVGRALDIAAVEKLLADPDVHLVTLTGPGGIGKTRLALRIAESMRQAFPDGVWFVPLASVRDAALLVPAIVQTLGLRQSSQRTAESALELHLRDRESLIILDNFEHLLEAGSTVAHVLGGCANLKMLVTSRATLRIYGEHQYRVPALTVHDPERMPADELRQSPSVCLFLDRASAARNDFGMTDENAAAIASICARCEGLPLAIELAAARISILSPEALLSRLDQRLPLLTGGNRDQPARLRSMRDAIAWSYDLLDRDQQSLLLHLATFVGGFTLEAAEAISNGVEDIKLGTSSANTRATVFSRLASLIDQSLIQSESVDGSSRFQMLETIREFGLEELQATGRLEEAQRKHATYFLEVGTTLAQGLAGAEMASALARFEFELPNMRAALSWALLNLEIERALRLTTDLYPFWNYRGHLVEGRRWLETILEKGGVDIPARADGLLAAAGLAMLQGDHRSASTLLDEAFEISNSADYRFGSARAIFLRGTSVEWQGNVQEAARLYEQALARVDDLGQEHWKGRVLGSLSDVIHILGDEVQAEELATEALEIARSTGHAWNMGIATGVLANIALSHGDFKRAVDLYEENIDRYETLGDLRGMGGCLGGLAGVAAARRQSARAARLLGAAQGLGDHIGVAYIGHYNFVSRVSTSVRVSMGQRKFMAEWQAGRALNRQSALAEAATLIADVREATRLSPHPAVTDAGLSRRETDVLLLLLRRSTDKEIAEALSISPRTVMHHVMSILTKLNLANRREAAEWAKQHDIE